MMIDETLRRHICVCGFAEFRDWRAHRPDCGYRLLVLARSNGLNDLVYTVTARCYCSCGDAIHTTAAWDTVADAVSIFWSEHQGKGHGATDPRTCRAARLRRQAVDRQQEHAPGVGLG